MRALLVGDLHANTGAAFEVLDHAAEIGADLVLQVGDYGWWPRADWGRKCIRKVDRRLALRGLDLWWVDGNHEDFDRLNALPGMDHDPLAACCLLLAACCHALAPPNVSILRCQPIKDCKVEGLYPEVDLHAVTRIEEPRDIYPEAIQEHTPGVFQSVDLFVFVHIH